MEDYVFNFIIPDNMHTMTEFVEAFQTSLKYAVTELALNNFLCGNQRNLQQP